MAEYYLPTYAIIELLVRLEQYNAAIGNYKNHIADDDGVIVKTTRGSIRFPHLLIAQQFETPWLISDVELANTALLFRAVN